MFNTKKLQNVVIFDKIQYTKDFIRYFEEKINKIQTEKGWVVVQRLS